MGDGKPRIASDFSTVFPNHVAALSRLLIRLRALTGGDLDMILILAVIGERHFARRLDPETPRRATLGTTETRAGPSINALSLSAYSGIPRETVRRKVAAMIERDWLRRDMGGNLVPTARSARDLEAGTRAALEFLAEVSPGSH